MSATPAKIPPAKGANSSSGLALQPAGVFLCKQQPQHHAYSPPMSIPPPSTSALPQAANSQLDTAAGSSFLAAIRHGLQDNSPSWDNNGWFIGDDSDDEDDDEDLYTSMLNPYHRAPEPTTVYLNGCAPAGSFAGFTPEGVSKDFVPFRTSFGLRSSSHETIRREGSLIFAMEV